MTLPFGHPEYFNQRPPALGKHLWVKVPRAERETFIRTIAMDLRRGIHPDDSCERLLRSRKVPASVVESVDPVDKTS